MSHLTRTEVLARKRERYARAGKEHKTKIINELVELFGYHRKVTIRALQARPVMGAPWILGRPKEYDPDTLRPPLKAIWLASLQPCGVRLKACLPDWLPAYEEKDLRRLDADVRKALLEASRATLDRLLIPARVEHRRRATTRPGTLLRHQIPIRTEWTENTPGFLEMDTVALCGGTLDDRHGWMFDAVDIHTTWNEMRALPNRSQAATLQQIRDVEAHLPLPLCGVDSDNGGEFINHHLVKHLQGREKPIGFTRSRPYRKNDNAHIEQKNYTQVRLWFGYERYDNPEVAYLFAPLKRPPQIAEEHEGSTSLIAAVEAGRGIALVQEGFQCLAGPRLKVRPLTPAPPPFVLGAAWRKGTQSPSVDNFIAAARRAKTAKL